MLCILDKMNVKEVLSIALNRKTIISIILLLLLWLIFIFMSHRDVHKSYIFEKRPSETDIFTKFTFQTLCTLKKLAIAYRYERNNELRKKLQSIITKLKFTINKSLALVNEDMAVEKITIILNFVNEIDINRVEKILNELASTKYKNVRILVGIEKDEVKIISRFENLVPRVTFIPIAGSSPHKKTLSILLESVTTSHVLVGREIQHVNNLMSLEKLMYPLFNNRSNIVGSAHTNTLGHWKLGCYQGNMLWYRYRLIEGYELNDNGYVHCDYISGPFAIKTDLLKDSLKDIPNELKGDQLYIDLMLKIKKKKLVITLCKSCTLYTSTSGMPVSRRDDWLTFVKRYQLNQVIIPNNNLFEYTCNEAGVKCTSLNGRFIPLCCHKELEELSLFTGKICNDYGFGWELDSGTALASVKLDNSLFWERDNDFNFRVDNITSLMKLQSVFKDAGYSLFERTEERFAACANMVFCGYVGVRSSNWRLELWGMNILSNDLYQKNRRILINDKQDTLLTTTVTGNLTLSRLRNVWVPIVSNPGAVSRGRYGVDILQHSQHWYDVGGKAGVYKPGKWRKCDTPDFHGCADLFLADGNIQFREVWL